MKTLPPTAINRAHILSTVILVVAVHVAASVMLTVAEAVIYCCNTIAVTLA